VLIDFLKHGSNAVLTAAIVAACAAVLSGFAPVVLWAIPLGALCFFASEYTTHRFLFHARPSKVPFVLRLQHRLHYDHHLEPSRLDLLFLPLWFVVPATLAFAAFYALATRGDAPLVFSLVIGSLCGLLYYEWVHFVAHVVFQPVTPYGRWIKKYHLWHHFKSERHWFGVTNPIVDVAGRSYVRVEDAAKSPSVRILHP
jgi:hypothetical protein